METITKLKIWMDENGYTNRTLAERMDFSYEYIYKIVNGGKPVTDRFEFLFIKIFGYEEAAKVFDVNPNFQAVEPQPV